MKGKGKREKRGKGRHLPDAKLISLVFKVRGAERRKKMREKKERIRSRMDTSQKGKGGGRPCLFV